MGSVSFLAVAVSFLGVTTLVEQGREAVRLRRSSGRSQCIAKRERRRFSSQYANQTERTLTRLQKDAVRLEIAAAVNTAEAPVKNEGRTRHGRDNKENIEVL